ncbi:MAG: L,D-transpeptidase family protein [Clostridia bacterium]|nr:L,D-transpeptidase family protein [Clostridia bacterium]
MKLSREWMAKIGEERGVNQFILVAGVGLTTCSVYLNEKGEDGKWYELMSTPAIMGPRGLGKERDGDGKTPIGTFKLNNAFGVAEKPATKLDYHKLREEDYWSADPNCHYNTMISLKDYPQLNTGMSEHLIAYPTAYEYGMNIDYNPECDSKKGNAIFLHCFGEEKPFTEGCVAVPASKMKFIMENIDPECVMVIDYLKNLSPETYGEWDVQE